MSSDIDAKIIVELIRNSKSSDRAIAKKLGVSQPTVTRRRTRLENRGLLEYTAIPNFEKFGFEILALSFVSYDSSRRGEIMKDGEQAKKIPETLLRNPNIIYASSGQGLGFQGVAISIHKDYTEYSNFLRSMRTDWSEYTVDIKSFVVSLKSDNIVRPITFKPFADDLSNQLRPRKTE